ncbi:MULTISPECIES: GIY-YIG nuclease family protein [Sorangium]|uniref:GIY-YIG nuclease family protein n=1 Tax=Sorangium TaxID=39643 RepID=UPI000B115401|nr:GIY-YIG nuclease family protein [Sorangium cellulosum]
MAAGWHVYILRCGDGSLYTGIARDVEARLAQHAAGRGARYTRGRGPLALVHVETAADKGEALRREAAIRRLGRAGKEALAARGPGRWRPASSGSTSSRDPVEEPREKARTRPCAPVRGGRDAANPSG